MNLKIKYYFGIYLACLVTDKSICQDLNILAINYPQPLPKYSYFCPLWKASLSRTSPITSIYLETQTNGRILAEYTFHSWSLVYYNFDWKKKLLHCFRSNFLCFKMKCCWIIYPCVNWLSLTWMASIILQISKFTCDFLVIHDKLQHMFARHT